MQIKHYSCLKHIGLRTQSQMGKNREREGENFATQTFTLFYLPVQVIIDLPPSE